MKIRLDVDGAAVAATLDDNDTARDFASQLPLTLTLEDYASAEKIADLPRRLSTNGAPAGTTASIGDVSYYAPWGNLALFHRPSAYASGLVRLGAIDDGVDMLRRPGSSTVSTSLIEK